MERPGEARVNPHHPQRRENAQSCEQVVQIITTQNDERVHTMHFIQDRCKGAVEARAQDTLAHDGSHSLVGRRRVMRARDLLVRTGGLEEWRR